MTTTAPIVKRGPEPALAAHVEPAFWLPAGSLCVRELLRFVRQRTRIVGALLQPFLFWILFGAGLGGTFKPPAWAPQGMTYQEYFLPGVAVLILLFTAIFSTISIIEDRREGFLQAVLVSPIPRASLVLGKVGGGTVLAVAQAVIFLLIGPALRFVGLAPQMHLALSPGDAVAVVAFLTLEAFALTSVGYVMAWPLDSTQGYHALMSVILMPMWLLSGSFFPVPASGWLSWVMRLNPLTYGVVGLQRFLFANSYGPGQSPPAASASFPGVATCVTVTILFSAIAFTLAVWLTNRRSVR